MLTSIVKVGTLVVVVMVGRVITVMVMVKI